LHPLRCGSSVGDAPRAHAGPIRLQPPVVALDILPPAGPAAQRAHLIRAGEDALPHRIRKQPERRQLFHALSIPTPADHRKPCHRRPRPVPANTGITANTAYPASVTAPRTLTSPAAHSRRLSPRTGPA